MWAHPLRHLDDSALSGRVVILEVRETNAGAMRFWGGLGFSEYGQSFRLDGEGESVPALIRYLFARFSGS